MRAEAQDHIDKIGAALALLRRFLDWDRAVRRLDELNAKVEDPTLWDAPWGGEYEFSALDGKMYEYACHEGNYAMDGILRGARVREKLGLPLDQANEE